MLSQPEHEYSKRSNKNAYYVVAVDVGRLGCTTEVAIIKVTPQPQGSAALKTFVNFYSIEAEDFEQQAIKIKKLYYRYRARQVVIDANGLGVGLTDFMTKGQIDPETGEDLPPFGCSGGTTTAEESVKGYKKIRGAGVEDDAMYLIKANVPINSEGYSYIQTQMSSGRLKFLIDEAQAKAKLMSTKVGQAMDSDARAEYLRPFTLTTVLREQMANMVEEHEGTNIVLKQSSRSIPKDRFSAVQYGLYYIKQEEDRMRKRRKRDITDFLFFT